MMPLLKARVFEKNTHRNQRTWKNTEANQEKQENQEAHLQLSGKKTNLRCSWCGNNNSRPPARPPSSGGNSSVPFCPAFFGLQKTSEATDVCVCVCVFFWCFFLLAFLCENEHLTKTVSFVWRPLVLLGF